MQRPVASLAASHWANGKEEYSVFTWKFVFNMDFELRMAHILLGNELFGSLSNCVYGFWQGEWLPDEKDMYEFGHQQKDAKDV